MGDSILAIADVERVMVELFRPAEAKLSQFADSDFDTISRLLSQVGKPKWSSRPRTYAVLRMIDRIDLFDVFILEGLKDIAFPYTGSRLPNLLSPTAKEKFLQAQNSVLTTASDLEKNDGRHRHLDKDADAHFNILKLLGRGGFGEVHHVRSKLSLEEYARKRVHRRKAFSKDREAIKIFENELINLKRLSHHHLVKFVGSYSDPKYVGLLMSPVADCDLKAFLNRDPFPKDDLHLLRGFFGCLCSAVLYLHNSKCRHKDLKPGNILVYINNILITDFGTARDWSEQSRSTTTGRSGAYTPGYAAPEVVLEEPRNSSADIWSLGCIYLDMMTVLGRETLMSKDQFFAEKGTGGANPRSNAKALELWLARLESETDREPLEWIKQMIRNAPNERITAAGLMDRIHSYEDGHVYYNSCCNGEEESEDEMSYQGSILEDASTIKDSENSTRVRMDDGVVNTVVPTLSQDLNEVAIQQRALPLGSLNSKNQIELEAVFQHSNAASKRAVVDARATQLLSDNGFNIHTDSFKIEDSLLWAVRYGHEAVVRLLLKKGVDIDTKANSGWTALHQAAYSGHEAVVRLLLEKGANAKAKYVNGMTVLHRAAAGNHEAVVRLLLEKGADIDTKANDGWTALHWAAHNGHEAVTRLLLEKGANVKAMNDSGSTALHHAASNKHEAVVRLLLEKGADIDTKANDGWTALHWAAHCGHEAVTRLLLEKEANVKAMNDSGSTALHHAASNKHEVVVRLLLEKGADINTKANDGWTALHWAAHCGHEAVTRLLLEKGANVKAMNDSGSTALHHAASNKHEAVVRLLLEKGADIDTKANDGWTALHWAAHNGHAAVTRLLLEKGANVKVTNDSGFTALHQAVYRKHEVLAQLLLEKGADVDAKDNMGRTALDWAADNKHKALVLLLLEKGADVKALAAKRHKEMVQLLETTS